MRFLRSLLIRFRSSRDKETKNVELSEELQFHLERQTEENIARGMSPEDARAAAQVSFGSVTGAVEDCYDARGIAWLQDSIHDLRYGFRTLIKHRSFSLVTILTLALGIGACTAVFSVVDPILFRPLPYAHADRLVSVGVGTSVQPENTLQRKAFMLGNFYFNWQENQKPFAAFTAQEYLPHHCAFTRGNPVQLACIGVEANFLPTLGVVPLLGRNFLPEEDRPNGPRVALVSYRLWVSRFNRNPGILNKLIVIDDQPVRVVGVLPRDFEMPTLDDVDVLVPNALNEAEERTSTRGTALRVFARLKPGVSIAQAKSQLKPLMESARSFAPPAFRNLVVLSVGSMRDFQMQGVREMAWIILGTVLAVFLIVCANVAGLFTARAAARSKELAVRVALGATRGRLIRQALTEAFLLAMAGAVTGCVLAEILLRVFMAIAPAGILFLSKARLDLRIVLFTIFLSLFCATLFGLVPALQNPSATSLAARSSNSGANSALRQGLVVFQIAMSMILMSGAMLLLRSLWNLQGQNLGMQTRHVMTVNVALSDRYETSQKQMTFYRQVELALRQLPGITAVGLSDSLPVGGNEAGGLSGQVAVAGEPLPIGNAGIRVVWRWVTPDYFRALGIPIVQGQNFTDEERSSNGHFLILSKLLASRMFPEGNAIGQSIKPTPDDPWYLVVGVAGDVRNLGLIGESEPEYYRLRRNFIADWDPRGIGSVIILATALPPSAVAQWVRFQIAHIDPTAPVDIQTLKQQVSKLASRPRFETALLGFFAFTGLLMAVIGLYGVTAFVATKRTQEIGVRMALGASRFNILRLVLWEGVRLIALGLAIGVATALVFTRLLTSFLYGVSRFDPATFALVPMLLLVATIAACLIPSFKAAAIDPMNALRHE
jgi:putative ABC transport system permease protein